MERFIAIDLGTTNSVISYIKPNEDAEIIHSKKGATLPSVVYKNEEGEVVIGHIAKQLGMRDPDHPAIYSIKRFMGQKFKDLPENLKNSVQYKIRPAEDGGVEVLLRDEWKRPEEISALILKELKKIAEKKLNDTIERVVITVPAYFRVEQRQSTADAAVKAGFPKDGISIQQEPIAASMAYAHKLIKEGKDPEKIVLVYDLGGGTFDTTVVNIQMSGCEILSLSGDNLLGGDDFDQVILKMFYEQIVKNHQAKYGCSFDPMTEGEARMKMFLKDIARETKEALSDVSSLTVRELAIGTCPKGHSIDLKCQISRQEFEKRSMPLVEITLKKVEKALSFAKEKHNIEKEDIEEILLVGGSTKMPIIKKTLAKYFNKEPLEVLEPDLCVAIGAAYCGPEVIVFDPLPLLETKETYIKIAGTTFPNAVITIRGGAKEISCETDSMGHFEAEVELIPKKWNTLRIEIIDQDGKRYDKSIQIKQGDKNKPRDEEIGKGPSVNPFSIGLQTIPDDEFIELIPRGQTLPFQGTFDQFIMYGRGLKLQVSFFEGDEDGFKPKASENKYLGTGYVDLTGFETTEDYTQVAIEMEMNEKTLIKARAYLPDYPEYSVDIKLDREASHGEPPPIPGKPGFPGMPGEGEIPEAMKALLMVHQLLMVAAQALANPNISSEDKQRIRKCGDELVNALERQDAPMIIQKMMELGDILHEYRLLE